MGFYLVILLLVSHFRICSWVVGAVENVWVWNVRRGVGGGDAAANSSASGSSGSSEWWPAGRNRNCSALCVDNECYVMLELEQANKGEVVIGQGLGRTTEKSSICCIFCVVRSFYLVQKKEQFALLKIVWISLCALCQMVLNGAKWKCKQNDDHQKL